ncbi:MAG: YdcF family protein [Oxalicibacterium faecigallinarum]|uniref:YdcF family protein n=1 Tax=Oxalicibacterium faecigallinarum TaxID=573741 RepID=UPI0028068984|nr:YdcF family protein [Oxalicibacterium faecigallinarum]MDQ7968116.1 YdcF family protein [Oxalicibacterium faecigallinarum]
MSTSWLINTLLGAVLLPPFNMLLLCGLGMLVRRRWPLFGMTLAVGSLLMLALLSTRPGAMLLAAPLENRHPALPLPYQGDAQAIVVLGGGRLANAPEYGHQDSPSSPTLRRMRYAAALHRGTGLPILVTGGQPDGAKESEAVIMARGLREDFGVPVKWLEGESDNTAENASQSADMLKKENVRRVLLVTDAMHMPRAVKIFERQGLQITPAPTAFYTVTLVLPGDFVPRTGWLVQSSYAMHEWIGILWYRLRYR